jgi:hypothetical protein
VASAARDLQAGSDSMVPADVAGLCSRVGQVPGVHLDQLLAALTDVQAAEDALRELIAQVRARAAGLPPTAGMAR